MTIALARGLELPDDFVTQSCAILARKGAGKTYTALKLTEGLIDAGQPVVALDPTGVWWGLRSSADGKRAGLEVIVLGGEHGDVPLERTAGKVIADLVVDHPGAYVLDLSDFDSQAAQDQFAADFAERLYRHKARDRSPLHLMIDEADSFAPQKPMPGQQRMLGAYESIMRRGRSRGLGMTMISQRPAVLNKNVLTQAEVLIVMQITSPQDRDAVDQWVKGNGTMEERRKLLDSLASMQQGEAWVWSPAWLRIFQRVKVGKRTTFDSSSTPTGTSRPLTPAKRATVDLDAVRDRIASTIEKAKAEDPKELRRRVSELERQLAARKDPEPKVERVQIPVVDKATVTALERAAEKTTEAIAKLAERQDAALAPLRQAAELAATQLERATAAAPPPTPQRSSSATRPVRASRPAAPPSPRGNEASTNGGAAAVAALGREMLEALGAFPDGLSAKQLAALVGKKASGGYFRNTLSSLRTSGLVAGGNTLVQTTDAGLALIGGTVPALTQAEILERWYSSPKMTALARNILEVLLEHYPDPVEPAELADLVASRIGKDSIEPTGGYFRNNVSFLSSNGLAQRVDRAVKASDDLFLVPA
jgi:hypothetical protein